MKDFLYPTADMSTIAYERDSCRKRFSSYDRTGDDDDRIYIKPGETRVLAEMQQAGCVNHIWMTLAIATASQTIVWEKNVLRKLVIRMFWDGETEPSVNVPLGDFFGMGHGICKNFVSAPLQMSPEDGKGLNCWFPMPYESCARIEIVSECEEAAMLYYYIDYEEYSEMPKGLLRFHAVWHRECPTKGYEQKEGQLNLDYLFTGKNTTGKENYVLLETEGRGHYVGCNINIHNLRDSSKWDWPGSGDDMIFIDGEKWPPNIHGTGTEDYVNTAWCPTQEYCAPYHGVILGGKENWKGKTTYYRYHIQDPIMFKKSIRVTMEHGHNNNRSDDWSSTAYWYQTEPHQKQAPLLPVEKRLPIDDNALEADWIIPQLYTDTHND